MAMMRYHTALESASASAPLHSGFWNGVVVLVVAGESCELVAGSWATTTE